MIQTRCSNLHTAGGQLGLTHTLTVNASGDLTPGGSLGMVDYYHTILIQPTASGIDLTLPSGASNGYRLMLVNLSGTPFRAIGPSVWTVGAQRARSFVFQDPGTGWTPADCESLSRPQDKVEVGFGIFVTTFSATERAYVGSLDPNEFKLLDTAQPSSIDDAENYAYYDTIGSLCHFNFRVKRNGIYLGNTDWFDAGIQGFTFALHIDLPSPHRPTNFTSLGYCYSLGGTISGDTGATPRDITGIILPDKSDPNKSFILYTYYGQRVLVADIMTAVTAVDYTFFGSGTYRLQA
jgi:hypothetical protein